MSKNWWKVIFKDQDNKTKILKFQVTAEAVAKVKELRGLGLSADVVSAVHGYRPTEKAGPRPSSKHYWCPYCIKWRIFVYSAVKRNGFRGPEDMRCPICLISDHDYYVRLYNRMLGEADLEMVYRLEGAFQRG